MFDEKDAEQTIGKQSKQNNVIVSHLEFSDDENQGFNQFENTGETNP